MADLTLEEEEPTSQFDNLNVESESLVTAPIPAPEVSRKRPWNVAPDEEELIKGSGLYVKRPQIPGCSDSRKWILKNLSPASLKNSDIRDHYAESLRFPSDVLQCTKHSKDDLPNAILGHILEAYTLIFHCYFY